MEARMSGKNVVTVALLIVGTIHLLPLAGVIGSARLTSLYGLPFDEPNLLILMRHRAVLFGLLGGFFVYAAFKRVIQPLAFLAGFVSVISFLWLAASSGGYNEEVGVVFVADLVALVALTIGAAVFLLRRDKAD